MYAAIKSIHKILREHDPIEKMNLDLIVKKLDEEFKPVVVTAEMVRELRYKTGYDLARCKRALVESKGLMFEASEYLRRN